MRKSKAHAAAMSKCNIPFNRHPIHQRTEYHKAYHAAKAAENQA